VESFLAGTLPFPAIAAVIENVLGATPVQPLDSVETAWLADREAREAARREVSRLGRATG
jgi:1-deoxy-D-xylulose-5-phosphate reductoisomerase